MAKSPFVRPFGISASILGIVQGLVWSILALMAILIHINAWTPKPSSLTYGGRLSRAILSSYVNGVGLENVFITPRLLFVWDILYLIGSLFWAALSAYQLWVVLQEKQKLLKKACFGWANWTLIVCVFDLILTSLLGSDYNTLVQQINSQATSTQVDYLKILACGIIMTLSARGFVLWILNVTFAIIVMKLSMGLPKKISESESDIINAFGKTPPRNWEPDKPKLNRSNSVVSSKSFGTFHGLPRLPPIQSTNQPLARLARTYSTRSLNNTGRPISTSSHLYPSFPSTPSPNNYSPSANSLQQPPLKSALKNRT